MASKNNSNVKNDKSPKSATKAPVEPEFSSGHHNGAGAKTGKPVQGGHHKEGKERLHGKGHGEHHEAHPDHTRHDRHAATKGHE